MTFEILIDSIDRTSDIAIDSLVKEDSINEQKDTLRFQVKKYGSLGFVPEMNQEVVMNIDGEKEYGGVIINIEKSIQAGRMVVYNVICSDYSQYLNRLLVLERYDNKTVDLIISDIIGAYASDFATTSVNCAIEIKTTVFNRLTISECLEKLAKTVGYSWYVDYDKVIHFFPKNENEAPFQITDTNGKYLQDTLKIKDDLSQLRNKVTIRGGEERALERTEYVVVLDDRLTYPLGNKFAEKPVVDIVTGPMHDIQLVGIDYLDKEEDFDCFWNFNEKYIRFKEDTKPNPNDTVEVTGLPLFPIIVKIPEPVSIAKYGIYEFFKEDKSITSRAEALKYAQAQLTAYKDGVIEGSFNTDNSGLRSGQVITINSTLLGIDESFLIQRVQFKALAKDKGLWSVVLATMRTIGIVQVLIDLIRFREIREFDPENLLTLIQFSDSATGLDVIGTPTTSKIPYFWVGLPDELGMENPIRFNFWTYSDE